MGGVSLFLYKKITDLESTIEDLKNQIMAQNNQIRYLLSPNLFHRDTNPFIGNEGLFGSEKANTNLNSY